MSDAVTYDPALFSLERAEATSSRLGEFILGESKLGSGTIGAWVPICFASFACTASYSPDDNGTLLVEAETATVSLSQWDNLPDPLYPSDRVRATYDGHILFRGIVDTTKTEYVADIGAAAYGATRRVQFSATLLGRYATMLGKTVCWKGLPAEPAITRIRRWVTVNGWD